jgi:putative ABC transport system permease protein
VNIRDIVPRSPQEQVDRELEFHVEMRTRELIARGINPNEARAKAIAAFGDYDRVREKLEAMDVKKERKANAGLFIADVLHDARFAFRMLARRRTFAALTIGVLALGIGATTAIFSVADGVLLRPLPFREPDRIAAVWIAQPALAGNPTIGWLAEGTPLGSEEYFALKRNTTTFQNIGIWSSGNATLDSEGGPEQVSMALATETLFQTLGVSPVLGRSFTNGEDALGGPSVAIMSWETFSTRFAHDTSIVGRSTKLGGAQHQIIGVMPPGFRVDRGSDPAAFWVPALRDSSDLPERRNRNYRGIARLARGATFEAANAEAGQLFREATRDTSLRARVEQWQKDEGRTASEPVIILLAAVGLLLMIACVNVAILQLGEVTARRREIAARIALGAGTTRLVRQLLAESVTLSITASIVGSALAWGMLRGLLAIAPERLPGMDTVQIDGRVLGFTLVCATMTGLLFGIVPALIVGRSGTAALTRTGAGQSARGHHVMQRTLIATQLALSMVLLVVGTLFARSLRNITALDPGFRADSLTGFVVYIPYRYPEERVRAIVSDVTRRFENAPGVMRVTVTGSPPFGRRNSSSPVRLDPAIANGRTPQYTTQMYVTPGYFEAMGIRLVEGRTFRAEDRFGSELVAIVNEAEVKRDFGGTSPLGQRVNHQNEWRTIVGVVGDVKHKSLTVSDGAGIYVPFDQHPSTAPTFLVRGSAQALSQPTVRAILRDVDVRVVLQNIYSMQTAIRQSYGVARYRTVLVSVFGAVAALLAAIGLYGVSLRAAARRMREVGIRMALGSSSSRVTGLLVGDAMTGVAFGIAIGLPAATFAAYAARKYLFGVEPHDPMSYLFVALSLSLATLVASALPARKAGKTNPAVVLRSD